MPDRQTITNMLQYQQPAEVPMGWNAICIINNGNTNARFDNFPIAPGETLRIGHNENEVEMASHTINFPDGYPVDCSVWVITIRYKDRNDTSLTHG